MDWLEEEKLLNKVALKELEFYFACEKVVKEIQYLESTDRVKVKMELAKIYRWFELKSEDLSRQSQNFFDPDLRRKPKQIVKQIDFYDSKEQEDSKNKLLNSERKLLDEQHKFLRLFPEEHAKYTPEEEAENGRIIGFYKYIADQNDPNYLEPKEEQDQYEDSRNLKSVQLLKSGSFHSSQVSLKSSRKETQMPYHKQMHTKFEQKHHMDSIDDLYKKSVDYRDENNNIVYKSEKMLPGPFAEDAGKHPDINYEYEPPGSLFKREMVEKYMQASPFMFRVSNPPQTVDLTDGQIGSMMNQKPTWFEPKDKSLICNEPKVNDFMISHHGRKQISNIKNLGKITPEVMQKLHDIMKPIDGTKGKSSKASGLRKSSKKKRKSSSLWE